MNNVVLLGWVVKDPIDFSVKDTIIVKFTIKVPRKFNKGDYDFIDCVAFGAKGTFVNNYIRKDIKILLEGRLVADTYTNKRGEKVYKCEVVVEEIEFAEPKGKELESNKKQDTISEKRPFLNITQEVEEYLPFR